MLKSRKVFEAQDVNHARMLKFSRWAKKHARYGVSMEVEETNKGWNVRIFSPKIGTDVLGNQYIKSVS